MESSQAPVHVADVPVPAQFDQLTMGEPVVLSTARQLLHPERESCQLLFVPIISIDRLSQDFRDLPVDDILALGDQALLHLYAPARLLEEAVVEPDVFGPLVNNLYGKINSLSLKTLGACEVLLYLSGHGMDPGNICLVPDAMKPHPTRSEYDLREINPDKWYKYVPDPDEVKHRPPDYVAEHAERYLDKFYSDCRVAIGSEMVPLGFVGGEVYAHHRGFIGVLGILGLWCYAHCDWKENTYSHLVIVADCCFAGIWGNTLESVMNSKALEEYRALLRKYPVSIQCATNGFEASRGGVFTPLWYFAQTAQEELDGYHSDFLQDRESVSDDDMEMQHPQYVSTSRWCPTWKCFDDPAFFAYLYGKQCQQLKEYLQRGSVTEGNCSRLVRPYIEALKGVVQELHEQRQQQLRRAANLARHPVQSQESLEETVRESIFTIQQSLASICDLLFEAARRSHALRPFVLVRDPNDGRDKLTKAVADKVLKKLCQPPHVKDISSGVYVFQGDRGDMSLIVTPEQEKVILIDGASNAECFYAAWDSTLRHLKRITHIFVTHHDEDHTNGIQLLLARYCVERLDTPDISSTIIYMNTRATFRQRNFKHEMEIMTLADREHLDLQVESLIIGDQPCKLVDVKDFFIEALLPKQSLVDEVNREVGGAFDGTCTKKVPSRGGTTAANVLSINLVAVWKKRDAYLFTGDAHLKDVTEAARNFLRIHCMDSFKYVDVPHHGSAKSNVTDVAVADRGMEGIPAEHYLISHCGNHHNPSFQTVKDILESDKCKHLHFLYPERRRALSCGKCHQDTKCWHCGCVKEEQHTKKICTTLNDNEPFKFFEF